MGFFNCCVQSVPNPPVQLPQTSHNQNTPQSPSLLTTDDGVDGRRMVDDSRQRSSPSRRFWSAIDDGRRPSDARRCSSPSRRLSSAVGCSTTLNPLQDARTPTPALRLPHHLHHREEKSTTKEATCLLEKCYGTFAARESNNLEVADAKLTPERRKVCTEELDQEGANGAVCGHSTVQYRKEDAKLLAAKLSEEDVSSQTEEDISAHKSPAHSLVKLTGGGLLLFTFPHEDSADTIKIVSDIIDSLGSGDFRFPHAIGVIEFFLSKLHAV